MDSFNPLDMTKLDHATAATRQKSCNACVRGKRRCDKKMPRCTRCAAKGLDCLYKKLPSDTSSPSAASGPAAHAAAAATATATGMAADGVCSLSDVPDFDMGFDMESLDTTDTSPESLRSDNIGLQHLDPALDFNFADLMAGSTNAASSADFWGLHGFGDSKMDLPPVPAVPAAPVREPTTAITSVADGDCAFDPLTTHDSRSRVGFITAYLTDLHRAFAQSSALPFMHPRLWAAPHHMPPPVLAAFSAAAAYVGRTPETRGVVLRLLADAARDVHKEGERTGLGPREKLARAQALLVLATMRLFDGDIAARAAVEREMGVMMAWADDLVAVRDELEGGAEHQVGASKERPPESWESWILLESVRRTVLMMYSFICMFYVLRSEDSQCDLWPGSLNFTASRHLWEAESSVQFYRAWREKRQYSINYMNFKEFWMYAQPDDLDEFTKFLLSTVAGPDVMDHFMEGDTSIPISGLVA